MRHFKRELGSYLLRHTFYSVECQVKNSMSVKTSCTELVRWVIWLNVIFVYFMYSNIYDIIVFA
jgi:hypothetical protein